MACTGGRKDGGAAAAATEGIAGKLYVDTTGGGAATGGGVATEGGTGTECGTACE